MDETIALDKDQRRFLIAIEYFNASKCILEVLRQQHKTNPFHFVITLRSFIEYNRRGIWFQPEAKDKTLLTCCGDRLTF